MKKLILFFLTQTFIFASSSILIINSYHKGYEWSDNIIQGIEKSLYKNKDIDTNILYMDSKRVTSKEYYKSLKNLYKIQLQKQKYDLIIAVDRFAYDLILESYAEFFTDEQILAVGIENFSKERVVDYGLEDKVSVILEKRDLEKNAQIIKTIYPSLKKLYIIDDKSVNASHTRPLIMELLTKKEQEYEMIYLQENNLQNLEDRFSKKIDNSAILFIRFYKNEQGKLYKNFEIANFIDNAKVPVFVTDSLFIKKGATGGKVIDLYKLGQSAGTKALHLLKNPSTSIENSKDFELIFDAKKLEEFTLPVAGLSEDFTIVNHRVTFFDKYRSFIDFIFRISPLFVLLIIGLIHNIYKRKKVEEELRQRLYFDQVLLNTIDQPIFWEDEKGHIVDCNKNFCSLIDVKFEDIYDTKLENFLNHEKINLIVKVLEKYKENKYKYKEFKYNDKNNNKKIFVIKQEKFEDTKLNKQGFVTIFTDVTKDRQIVKEKQRDKQFIIQQSKLAEIGEVFSSIAHQWKSPLVEITTIAQELFYSKKTPNKNIKESDSFVSDIMKQVNYMTDTINNFQSFVMPSNEKNNFFVDQALKSMLDIVHHNLKYNNIKIELELQKNTDFEVYGYKNEFMQSFLNIIINAKEQLLNNDYKNRYIFIRAYNKQSMLYLEVEDNAGGIKEKNIKKIFKPYYTTKEKGHGIGLYMSKMIIEDKMDGKIMVKNSENGVKFTIKLDQNR
jgi:PAS domain S-box-containing protein